MKLTSAQIKSAASQFEAEAVPEGNPILPKLRDLYGEHTFLLAGNGLHIVEPAEPNQPGSTIGRVVKLASWTNPDHTTLATHPPAQTDIVIDLDMAA
jgi:hypothetical protein